MQGNTMNEPVKGYKQAVAETPIWWLTENPSFCHFDRREKSSIFCFEIRFLVATLLEMTFLHSFRSGTRCVTNSVPA